VRPRLVVVAAVDAEHVLDVAGAENDDSIETIRAEHAYPAFGVGVRGRRLYPSTDDLDARAPEDLVEGVANLASRPSIRNRNGVLLKIKLLQQLGRAPRCRWRRADRSSRKSRGTSIIICPPVTVVDRVSPTPLPLGDRRPQPIRPPTKLLL
jgi:hypothetical protein